MGASAVSASAAAFLGMRRMREPAALASARDVFSLATSAESFSFLVLSWSTWRWTLPMISADRGAEGAGADAGHDSGADDILRYAQKHFAVFKRAACEAGGWVGARGGGRFT